MIRKIRIPLMKKFLIFLLIFSLGVGFGYIYFARAKVGIIPIQKEKNTPKAFLSEIYDKIEANYWDNISDATLIEAFKNASSALGNPLPQKIETKDELIKNLDQSQAAKLVSQVLNSMQPIGRSGLYTQKQEEQLKNTVENINPQKDLYKDLGVSKGASEAAVSAAYQKKQEELKNDNSQKAQEEKKQIAYARDVLTKKETKERYDEKGVEPALFAKLITPDILYLKFSKFTPTSLDEFQQALNPFSNSPVKALIFDLRGNIGGAIDATAYFLGFFIGKNQYAFDFYHKGEYMPFKTQTDKLEVLKKIRQTVILVDSSTQSSAEMLAASLKKYNVGIVLGSTTKGWGTVEKVFPLDNQFDNTQKYSLFLVHSVTLRDDNQPIEGRGVEPNINIKDPDWQSQLFSYFRNQSLIDAVKTSI